MRREDAEASWRRPGICAVGGTETVCKLGQERWKQVRAGTCCRREGGTEKKKARSMLVYRLSGRTRTKGRYGPSDYIERRVDDLRGFRALECSCLGLRCRRVWRSTAVCQTTRDGTRHTLRPRSTCERRIKSLPLLRLCSTRATEVIWTATVEVSPWRRVRVSAPCLKLAEAQLTTQKRGRHTQLGH